VFKQKIRNLNILHLVLECPVFAEKSGSMNIEEYLAEIRKNAVVDPVLSLANVVGFEIGNYIDDYYADDDSKNYGVTVFKRV